MTQSGSTYDNALAERVNGIIKNEFYPKWIYQNHKEASEAITKIIQIYNSKRPHASIDYQTPDQAHVMKGYYQSVGNSIGGRRKAQLSQLRY